MIYQKNLTPESCDAAFSVDPKSSYTGTASTSGPPIPEKWVQVAGRRYYSPELGRWLNRDPLQEDGGLNLYAFLANSTPQEIDLLGMAAIPPDVVRDVLAMGKEEMKVWIKNNPSLQRDMYRALRRANPAKAQDFKWAQKFARLRNVAKRNNSRGIASLQILRVIMIGGCVGVCAVRFRNCLDTAMDDLEDNMDITQSIADPVDASHRMDNSLRLFYLDAADCATRYTTCALSCCLPFAIRLPN